MQRTWESSLPYVGHYLEALGTVPFIRGILSDYSAFRAPRDKTCFVRKGMTTLVILWPHLIFMHRTTSNSKEYSRMQPSQSLMLQFNPFPCITVLSTLLQWPDFVAASKSRIESFAYGPAESILITVCKPLNITGLVKIRMPKGFFGLFRTYLVFTLVHK